MKKTALRFSLYPNSKREPGLLMTLESDTNAARIVPKRGIAQVGQDMPELKPVETGPLHLQTAGGASQVDEAETTRNGKGAGWKPTD